MVLLRNGIYLKNFLVLFGKVHPLLEAVVLVNGDEADVLRWKSGKYFYKYTKNSQLYLVQCESHLEGANGVHVCGNDGNARVVLSRAAEGVLSLQVYFGATFQRRTLRSKEDILEVQFDTFLDFRHSLTGFWVFWCKEIAFGWDESTGDEWAADLVDVLRFSEKVKKKENVSRKVEVTSTFLFSQKSKGDYYFSLYTL